MRALFLRWLPTFSLILGGSILLSSVIIGLYRALKHVGGYLNHPSCDNNSIDRIVEIVLSGGMFGISQGILWLILVEYGEANEAYLFHTIITGGILGPLLIEIFKRARVTTRRIADKIPEELGDRLTLDEVARIVGGMSFGVVVSGLTFIIGAGGGNGDLGLFGDALAGIILGTVLFFWLYGMAIGWGAYKTLPVVKRLARMIYAGYVIFVSREKTIICDECLRYTHPLYGRYEYGKRFCEHCQKEVARTKDPGTLIFLFGIILDKPVGTRTLLISNPDVETRKMPFDVSQVYIDTKTCNIILLERFITHTLNYPPTSGLQSVQILYQGSLDNLGLNLKNALQNNFTYLQQIS